MLSLCSALLPNETFLRLLALWNCNTTAGFKALEVKAESLGGLRNLLCKYFTELDAYHSEEDYIHLQNANELASEIRSILVI